MLGSLSGRRILGAMLVSGWAVYLTVVAASNLTDLLVSFKWIETTFHSGNLAFIATATRIYFRSRVVDQILLACALIWEAGTAALLWYGMVTWWRSAAVRTAAAEAGLIMLTLLWMAFAIATEIFVAYARGVSESSYWVLAVAALATLLVLVHLRREAT